MWTLSGGPHKTCCIRDKQNQFAYHTICLGDGECDVKRVRWRAVGDGGAACGALRPKGASATHAEAPCAVGLWGGGWGVCEARARLAIWPGVAPRAERGRGVANRHPLHSLPQNKSQYPLSSYIRNYILPLLHPGGVPTKPYYRG